MTLAFELLHTQCRWALSNLLRAQIEQKAERKEGFTFPVSLFEMGHLIFCPQNGIYTISPLVLRLLTQTELHHQLSWVSCLQTAYCGTAQPPYLCEPISDKFLDICTHLYIYPVGFVSLKNPNLTSNDEMNNFKAPIMHQVLLLGYSVCSVHSVIYWVTIWMPSVCHAVC